MATWQPSASINLLRERAQLIGQIRTFFSNREVLEVETPSLSMATVTDVHLHTFQTEFVGPGYSKGQSLSMMTSPEFHMKRLLSAGSGSIFQLCKAFRNEESGRYHNPEFLMLEWYRVGFNHHDLMDEMDSLLQGILNVGPSHRMTYQSVFQRCLGVCPLEGTMTALKAAAATLNLQDIAEPETDRDTLLQLLFSIGVEPHIGVDAPAFVYDFPASQAALARISPHDPRVAERFEVYFKGVELANGFHELSDPVEQRQRFEKDNQSRIARGLAPQSIDENLLSALDAGLPDCAGVALGVDRLVMLALGCDHIDQVLAFPIHRA